MAFRPSQPDPPRVIRSYSFIRQNIPVSAPRCRHQPAVQVSAPRLGCQPQDRHQFHLDVHDHAHQRRRVPHNDRSGVPGSGRRVRSHLIAGRNDKNHIKKLRFRLETELFACRQRLCFLLLCALSGATPSASATASTVACSASRRALTGLSAFLTSCATMA